MRAAVGWSVPRHCNARSRGQIVVLVPAAVIELHEAHVRARPAGARAGSLPHRCRACATRVHRDRRCSPAPSRDPSDPARRFASGTPSRTGECVSGSRDRRIVRVLPVQLADCIEHPAARVARDSLRVLEVQHGIAAGSETHSLVARRKKATGPKARKQRLVGVDGVRLGEQHDERRAGCRSRCRYHTGPGAQARAAGLLRACLNERDRRIVIDRVRVDCLHDGEIVDNLRGVRKQFAHPCAGLAVLIELEDRRSDRQGSLPRRHAGDALTHAHRVGQLDAAMLLELRVCSRTGRAGKVRRMVQKDDALGRGCEVRRQRRGPNARTEMQARLHRCPWRSC